MSLSNFKRALAEVLKHEGDYALVPGDRGGETYKGVARKAWPKWVGWKIIDQVISEHFNGERKPTIRRNVLRTRKLNKLLNERAELQSEVALFYLKNFWLPLRANDMPPQVGRKVFNMAVNIGTGGAGRVLQRALLSLGAKKLVVDGVIGPKTIKALIHIVDAYEIDRDKFYGVKVLIETICRVQADYYRRIVAKRPAQAKFLKGWLRRAAYMGA